MINKLLFTLSIALAAILTVNSCGEKVTRVDIGLSPKEIDVPQAGGSYTINSKVGDYEFSDISILLPDGKLKVTDSQDTFEEIGGRNRLTAMKYEWVSVKKVKNSLTGRTEMIIDIAENDSGQERACLISVGAADSMDGVKVSQK